jgi:transcriptional regulator with XRE-family HTH domain
MLSEQSVGQALRLLRQLRGLTRQELGARAGGVAISTVARIERGEVEPHPSTLAALTRVLNAPASTGRGDD